MKAHDVVGIDIAMSDSGRVLVRVRTIDEDGSDHDVVLSISQLSFIVDTLEAEADKPPPTPTHR